MSDHIYFSGDPAHDSARRHLERVLWNRNPSAGRCSPRSSPAARRSRSGESAAEPPHQVERRSDAQPRPAPLNLVCFWPGRDFPGAAPRHSAVFPGLSSGMPTTELPRRCPPSSGVRTRPAEDRRTSRLPAATHARAQAPKDNPPPWWRPAPTALKVTLRPAANAPRIPALSQLADVAHRTCSARPEAAPIVLPIRPVRLAGRRDRPDDQRDEQAQQQYFDAAVLRGRRHQSVTGRRFAGRHENARAYRTTTERDKKDVQGQSRRAFL